MGFSKTACTLLCVSTIAIIDCDLTYAESVSSINVRGSSSKINRKPMNQTEAPLPHNKGRTLQRKKNKKLRKKNKEKRQQKQKLRQIRFDKIGAETARMRSQLPLTTNDYPLHLSLVNLLRSDSKAVSVVTDVDIIQRTHVSVNSAKTILKRAGLLDGPTYPSDPEFWHEFDFVTIAQLQRQECGNDLLAKEVWDVPKDWLSFNLNEAAKAVNNEYPAFWQSKHLDSLFGPSLKIDHSVIPKRSNIEFLLGPVMLAEINSWAVGIVGTYDFVAKWMYGMPRPEEIAWKIKTGDIGIDHGVPQDVIDNVMQLQNFHKMEDYSAYQEGCPYHPSWPAMHSAASSLSFWLAVLCDLTSEQHEEVKRVDYAVSFARTIAGVHFLQDNIDGLNFGQELLAMELPPYLAATYGSDPEKVRKKIESVRFDWTDYHRRNGGMVPSCPHKYENRNGYSEVRRSANISSRERGSSFGDN